MSEVVLPEEQVQYIGTEGNDFLQGVPGKSLESFSGLDGDDTIKGKDGNDTIDGDSDNDELFGEADDDVLFGDFGNDTLNGGSGDDTLAGHFGDDSIVGGSGNDFVLNSEITTGDPIIGSGFDIINTGSGDDLVTYVHNLGEIRLGSDNDILEHHGSTDEGDDLIVFGGKGYDEAYLSGDTGNTIYKQFEQFYFEEGTIGSITIVFNNNPISLFVNENASVSSDDGFKIDNLEINLVGTGAVSIVSG